MINKSVFSRFLIQYALTVSTSRDRVMYGYVWGVSTGDERTSVGLNQPAMFGR